MRRQADIALRFARPASPGVHRAWSCWNRPVRCASHSGWVMHADVRRAPHVGAVADEIVAVVEQA